MLHPLITILRFVNKVFDHCISSAFISHDDSPSDCKCDVSPEQHKPESWNRNQMNFVPKDAVFKPTPELKPENPADSNKDSQRKLQKQKQNGFSSFTNFKFDCPKHWSIKRRNLTSRRSLSGARRNVTT